MFNFDPKYNCMLDVLISNAEDKKPGKVVYRMSDRADKPVKSALKAVSWRIIGTLDTMIISYIITGKLTVAVSIGSVEVFTKMILYYFHERMWAHIHSINFKRWIIRRKRWFKSDNKSYGVAGIKQSA
jgi:uncharacterized membrane protein